MTTAAPRPPRPLAVGAACGPASVCAAGSSCVSGACACDAAKTACNGECLDYQTDPNSCGDCGRVCVHASCNSGVCVPMEGPPPPSAFANVVPVAPSAGSICRHETEAYPTRSLNTGDIFAPILGPTAV